MIQIYSILLSIIEYVHFLSLQFQIVKKEYPSLGDISTSYLVSNQSYFMFRTISLISHIIVIVLGIYTRRLVFFIQFTNWTNLLSTVYSLLAFITSYKFSLTFYNQSDMQKVYQRTKPSKLAYFTSLLLRLTLPMHFIVTNVFWIIVFKTADRNHGDFDLWYFIFAHDGILGKVEFNMSIIPLQFLYAIIYVIFGVSIFLKTEYKIYRFMDITQKENVLLMLGLLPVIVLFNAIIVILDKIKIFISKQLLMRKATIPQNVMKKRIKRRKVRDDKSFPEMSF